MVPRGRFIYDLECWRGPCASSVVAGIFALSLYHCLGGAGSYLRPATRGTVAQSGSRGATGGAVVAGLGAKSHAFCRGAQLHASKRTWSGGFGRAL